MDAAAATIGTFPLREQNKFRAPSISLVLGQTMGGKTTLSEHIVRNWTDYYSHPLDKVTIFYPPDTDLNSGSISFTDLPYRNVVRHRGVEVDQLRPERLRSPSADGHALCILEDLLNLFLTARGQLEERIRQLIIRDVHHSRVRDPRKFG